MKIALLEFIDEFHDLEKYIQREDLGLDDFFIVALEPKLGAYLKSRNITYQNTLPYFNNDSHRSIIVETEKITEYIRQTFDFSDGNGLTGCHQREYIHYIRQFANHLLKILEVIGNIQKSHNNVELYAYVSHYVPPDLLMSDNERYCGILAQSYAESKKLKFININSENEKHSYLKINDRVPARWLNKAFAHILVRYIKKKQVIVIPLINSPFSQLISELAGRNKQFVFLAVGSSRDLMNSIFANMFLIFRHIFIENEPLYLTINTGLFHSVIGDTEKNKHKNVITKVTGRSNKELYTYRGVDYSHLIENRVKTALMPHMSRMLSYSYALQYIFTQVKNYLVISYLGSGIMAVAGELAKIMGKSSLFISHGTHPVPVDHYHELELNTLSRTFMLGDFTHVGLSVPTQEAHLHYFKDKYSDIDNHEIKTGPLVFADINGSEKSIYKKQLGISPDTIVITHAVTAKGRQSERYYFIETLDEFFSELSDLVYAMDFLEDVILVLRIHPGFYLNNNEIETLLPKSNKYTIHREGPFSDVLAATDILLSYSSTAIDEALINGIPVMLYDKWDRYNHFGTGVFDSSGTPDIFPVCYVNSHDKLREALEFMIEKVRPPIRDAFDVSKYKYRENYKENFFNFIEESLK